MTREEREKAIDALEISIPITAVTQEKFNNYLQTLNNIKDWLEQEPCEDAISRQAVLAIAEDSCLDLDSYEDTKEFCNEIKELPPVTPQPKTGHWIPVSERLPESGGMYIVTRKIYDCPDTEPIIMSDESWFDGQNWHNDNRINYHRRYLSDVIAWMPLPEPYEAESEE